MKNYFLLFISTMLMLFILPKYGSDGSSISGMEKGVIKEVCSSKRLVKRNCTKGCLKHQTHSEQQSAATVLIDCSQPFYAIVNPLQQQQEFTPVLVHSRMHPLTEKLLSPHLEVEPDPPRFS